MRVPAPAATRLAVPLVLALATSLATAGTVPAGFEDLVEGQTEQLEVRLFDRSAGLSPVRVTLDSIQLEAPAEVLRVLDISPEGRAALLPALSRLLPRNGHLACRHGDPDAGCGYLAPPDDPRDVHVIYDEGEGVLRLFVARRWIPEQQPVPRFHVATRGTENAFLHQQVLNVSGSRAHHVASVRGAGVLGMFERGHVAAEWSAMQQRYGAAGTQSDVRLDSVWYRHDLGPQHYLQLGRMDRRNLSSVQGGSFGFGMLPLDRFQGLRFGSTQAYVNMDEAAQATPITVLLARDARVEAFDGDRLLQTYELHAGIHQLDTRSFPFGSYTVQLRIHEDGVYVRSEDTPFDKGGGWTDTGVQWVVQAGRRTPGRRDQFDGDRVMMAGVRVPFGPDVATTLGMTDVGGITYGEARVDLRYRSADREMRVGLSAMAGNDGSHGQQHQLSYRRRMSWNLHHQRSRGAACLSRNDTRDHLACTNALSASISLPVGRNVAHVGYTRRETRRPGIMLPGDDAPSAVPSTLLPPMPSTRAGTEQRSAIWQGSYSHALRWSDLNVNTRIGAWTQRTGDAAQSGRDHGVYLNVAFSRMQRGDAASGQRRHAVDMRVPARGRADITYSTGTSLYQDHDGSVRELITDLRGSNQRHYSASVSGMLQNRFGQSGLTLSRYQQPGQGVLAYGMTHASGFALGGNGVWWGDGAGADAAVAVQMGDAGRPDVRGVAAELQLSGSRRLHLDLGERRLLRLAAYARHDVDIMDSSAPGTAASVRVAGVSGAQHMFLPPGRLQSLTVPVEITYTFIGQAHDATGQPLQGARILNATGVATGAKGGFVLELPRRDEVLYLLQDGRVLQCPLTVRERRSVLLMVGVVSCGSISVASVPEWLREQPRVARLLQESALMPAPQHTGGESP